MRTYPAPSYARVSDGKERTQSETIGSGLRISGPHLPQLRSGRVVIQRPPERGSLPGVWLRAESQCLGNAPADNRPAGCPRKPRLRVRSPRDAPPPRRSIPLSGLPFGGPTGKIRMPRKPSARAGIIADQVAEIPTYRHHGRNSASGALCERRKEVTYERSFPQATGACGEVANIRDEGGFENVYRTH